MADKATREAALSAASVSTDDDAVAEHPPESAVGRRRGVTAAYVLGICVQVVFWMLVFLALAMAIGVGEHLTEFRYVGF